MIQHLFILTLIMRKYESKIYWLLKHFGIAFFLLNFTMLQNYPPYPNPFNSVTTIAYDLPNDGAVNLSIYNLRGALIEELETGFKNAGSYKISWEAGNLASGLYFVKFTSSDFSATRKLLFLK